jgi:ATP-dependent 26S proteasome regulatory subunit
VNEELLESLLAALAMSPDNELLRRQVVDGLVAARRWSDVQQLAPPLLEGAFRAQALLALSRAALAVGQRDKARELYRDAITTNPGLVDEGFEAALEPENALRVPTIGNNSASAPPPISPEGGRRVTFNDVGGMEKLKEQIRLKIIYPFQQPHVYAAYGKKIGGGIMMYGPPGCGKTYIARATAGELGVHFYTLSLPEILDMWLGNTEKNLSHIFETARANAPAVLFIDEMDALGAKRSDIHTASVRMMVSQFLIEMDGISANNEQLLVLGATNAPWSVDPALRRPGRFDRVLFVPPPDTKAREEILKLHARGRKIDGALPWPKLADKTPLFSGADLTALVENATESALAEALRSGRMRDVTMQDFSQALAQAKPSTMEWLRRAKNYVTYSNQDGFYDDLSQFLAEARIR